MTNERDLWLDSMPLEVDDAAWARLEAEALGRGADCPYVGDLIELALGEADPATAEALHAHLQTCRGCRLHYEAYQRGLKDVETPEPCGGSLPPEEEDTLTSPRGERTGEPCLESIPLEEEDAAWARLEADALRRGAGCPYIGDLIELALGETEPATAEALHAHLAACRGCRLHFDSYRRGLDAGCRSEGKVRRADRAG